MEGQGRVAREDRRLAGEPVGGVLEAGDGVGRALALALVQVVRQVVADAVDDQAGVAGRRRRVVREVRVLAGAVGDLEGLLRGAEDQRHPVGRIQDVVEVAERLDLVAVVVQRVGAAVRRFDADAGVQEAARHERAVGAPRAAVFEARLDLVVAAAVDRDVPAVLEAALGGDVDHAGRAQAVLGRQGAGDQLDVGGQARAQGLAEHRKALGQDHVVQPVLHVGVVAADMQLAEGVLHHARRLQDHLVQRHVLAARQDVDHLLGQRIGGGAQRRLHHLARLVQPLGRHHHLGDARSAAAVGRGRRRRRGLGRTRGGIQAGQADGREQKRLDAHATPPRPDPDTAGQRGVTK